VQVKIVSTIPATLARIVGRQEFTNVVTAIAHAEDSTPSPLFGGAALVTLKQNGTTFTANGSAYLDVNNSGVFINSTDRCGMSVVGAGEYWVDTEYAVAGAYGDDCEHGAFDLNGPIQPTSPVPYPPDIMIPIPDVVCSGTGQKIDPPPGGDTITLTPGTFPGGVSISSTQHVIFQPGNYCFGGNVSITGSANVIANDVNFEFGAGGFSTGGSSSFTCNNALFHVDGGTGVSFGGTSSTYCNNVTFIASTGSISGLGNGANRLYAPKGGLYEDVLIYMPYGNTSNLTLAGNQNAEYTGTILAIQAPITITGVSSTTGLHSQIIGYTIDLQGSSNTVIHYDPDEQYAQVDPSAITLTK
jgi:hypothetical protein